MTVTMSGWIWLCMGTIYPVYLVYKEKRLLANQNNGVTKKGLLEILRHPLDSRVLLDYLQSEFSTENLLFWERVESLKNEPINEFTLSSILSIYNDFIKENSSFEINLSAVIKEQIENSYQSACEHWEEEKEHAIHMFDNAQRNIFELLNNDSFPRFQRTNAYINLSASSEQLEMSNVSLLSASGTGMRDEGREILV